MKSCKNFLPNKVLWLGRPAEIDSNKIKSITHGNNQCYITHVEDSQELKVICTMHRHTYVYIFFNGLMIAFILKESHLWVLTLMFNLILKKKNIYGENEIQFS